MRAKLIDVALTCQRDLPGLTVTRPIDGDIAVLVIDDERQMLEGLGELLTQEGDRLPLAPHGDAGLRLLRKAPVHIVLTDLRMPGLDGLAVLRHVRKSGADPEGFLLTAHGSIALAVEAMKHGAYDFRTKPPDSDRLLHLVRRAAGHQAMVRRTRRSRPPTPPWPSVLPHGLSRPILIGSQV